MVREGRALKVAVIGLGVFGESVALALVHNGCQVLAIDRDARLVQRLSAQIHGATLDTTSEEALRSVDIMTFDAVIVASGADFENNVLTTAVLKSLGVRHIICRSMTAHEREVLVRVGADRVVEPDCEAAGRLARDLMIPGSREQMPLGREQTVATLQVPLRLAGYSLDRLASDASLDVTVLMIQRDEELMVGPPANTSWEAGDLLLVMARNEAVATLSAMF